MKKHILSFFLFFCIVLYSQDNQDYINDVDDFVKMVKNRFDFVPGFSVAIVKNDKSLLIKGYGYTDASKSQKVDLNTSFYIASTTKSFIGILASILAYEGKIDLLKPLIRYKPFKSFSKKEIFKTVNVNQLLSHTSGLTNNYIPFIQSYLGNNDEIEMIELLEYKTNLIDKKYKYSNLGYNIFDIILKEELKLNWKNALEEKLFIPLSMTRTTAYISKVKENNWVFAKPYVSGQASGNNETYMKTDKLMHAAGGLFSSANDLANWLLFNINSGEFNKKQIYPPDVIKNSHQVLVSYEAEKGQIFKDNGYGLGWKNAKYDDSENVIYHFGGYSGFQSHISFMPDDKIGVAILSNEEYLGDNINSLLATYIYDILLEKKINATKYEEMMERIEALHRTIQENSIAKFNEIKNRPWTLKLPKKSYVGSYENENMGEIKIYLKENDLHLVFGELKAIARPSKMDNAFEAELILGRPMNFTFETNDNREVKEINVGGEKFTRINTQ